MALEHGPGLPIGKTTVFRVLALKRSFTEELYQARLAKQFVQLQALARQLCLRSVAWLAHVLQFHSVAFSANHLRRFRLHSALCAKRSHRLSGGGSALRTFGLTGRTCGRCRVWGRCRGAFAALPATCSGIASSVSGDKVWLSTLISSTAISAAAADDRGQRSAKEKLELDNMNIHVFFAGHFYDWYQTQTRLLYI